MKKIVLAIQLSITAHTAFAVDDLPLYLDAGCPGTGIPKTFAQGPASMEIATGRERRSVRFDGKIARHIRHFGETIDNQGCYCRERAIGSPCETVVPVTLEQSSLALAAHNLRALLSFR